MQFCRYNNHTGTYGGNSPCLYPFTMQIQARQALVCSRYYSMLRVQNRLRFIWRYDRKTSRSLPTKLSNRVSRKLNPHTSSQFSNDRTCSYAFFPQSHILSHIFKYTRINFTAKSITTLHKVTISKYFYYIFYYSYIIVNIIMFHLYIF